MAKVDMLMLNGGGMRSLVASAICREQGELAMLFVHDGWPSAAPRHLAFMEQAEHFGVSERHEVTMRHLRDASVGRGLTLFGQFQMIGAAMGLAEQLGTGTVVWPVTAGSDYDSVAAVTEAAVVLQQLGDRDSEWPIKLVTPLLELTDRQLVELGHQMDVPWAMARTCLAGERRACGACDGCKRRTEAFGAAGIADPMLAGLPVS